MRTFAVFLIIYKTQNSVALCNCELYLKLESSVQENQMAMVIWFCHSKI